MPLRRQLQRGRRRWWLRRGQTVTVIITERTVEELAAGFWQTAYKGTGGSDFSQAAVCSASSTSPGSSARPSNETTGRIDRSPNAAQRPVARRQRWQRSARASYSRAPTGVARPSPTAPSSTTSSSSPPRTAPPQTFAAVMATAEAVRNNPASTDKQLQDQRQHRPAPQVATRFLGNTQLVLLLGAVPAATLARRRRGTQPARAAPILGATGDHGLPTDRRVNERNSPAANGERDTQGGGRQYRAAGLRCGGRRRSAPCVPRRCRSRRGPDEPHVIRPRSKLHRERRGRHPIDPRTQGRRHLRHSPDPLTRLQILHLVEGPADESSRTSRTSTPPPVVIAVSSSTRRRFGPGSPGSRASAPPMMRAVDAACSIETVHSCWAASR